MSCNIYCIEDINGLKYVGSTILTLERRLNNHIADKKRERGCSSCHLDLDNCKIYQLEECDISHRKQREKYWINNTDCVNIVKYNFDKKQYMKDYKRLDKEKHNERNREYNFKNKETLKIYYKKRYKYQCSWGGSPKGYNNNLLKISLDIFH